MTSAHDKIQIREWQQLDWENPSKVLLGYREAETEIAEMDLPPEIRHLRTNELKPFREGREAALFAVGMSSVQDAPVEIALHEDADYDFVARTPNGDTIAYLPIQLKEWVPPELRGEESLNQLLAKIARKYPSPSRTTVAVHINRPGRLDLAGIIVPEVDLGGLWLFGALDSEQNRWCLYGSLLHGPSMHEFSYPAAAHRS